ncbi:SDR family oxidoreductase [Pleomorphomonas carboxyditropha]|uniref:3-beta hydroxysteroid dehydrogenase n=1 Tax=Pleomorphomonas carboxyditropha TaxID=2023338 RepID=A0A2G9X0S1_9HYPH|nr:SDR family oxidoreductase [Pleomorphomonas carboxyditropha]PIP00579.1 3-beta hydroxysteroid dehydrogenase [Pleomorphomonas carboxyditropha]
MRVFVTGATGFVGSAVVSDLIAAGHSVLGLSRSQAGAAALRAAGADVHPGSLEDIASLKAGAAASDAVVHTAFVHDFSRFGENCDIDRQAIAALGEALAGSGRPLVVTSALGMLSPGRLATEDMVPPADAHVPRVSEQAALAFVSRGVRAMAIRLPQVHGAGDHGFTPQLVGIARDKGAAAYVGDGANRWPAVHRFDAARLYRLAVEKGTAGARYHAVADEGVPLKTIAEIIGRRLGLPVKSIAADEAADHFGWFAAFAAMDCPASSDRTRRELGWQPTGIGLIEDLDSSAYFPS